MSFYAVRFGRIPGIYTSWNECRKQVSGFKGVIYKKFATEANAITFYKKKTKTYADIQKKNKLLKHLFYKTKFRLVFIAWVLLGIGYYMGINELFIDFTLFIIALR